MIENIYRRLAAADRSGGSMAHRVFEAGARSAAADRLRDRDYHRRLSADPDFQEVEGKMFRPMALTVIFALAGSLIFALTLVPVLASLLLRPWCPSRALAGRVASRLHERFAW